MKIDEQNLAIAEYFGWSVFKRSSITGEVLTWKSPDGSVWLDDLAPLQFTDRVQDMYCAVKQLPDAYHNCYIDNLMIAILGDSAQVDGSYEESWKLITATPAESAKAFLKTIGKWVE